MIRYILFFLTLAAMTTVCANSDIEKVSRAFGHLIGKNLETMDVEFDINLVMQGLKESASGKESPMTESECIQAITAAQEQARQKKAEINLATAEAFLKENGKKKNVVVVDGGKLQYKVEKTGTGKVIQVTDTPLIHYVGKFADGSVFGESTEAESISLEETIQGFKKGIAGMKEGEKRTLYIHPEYGYGTQGYLPPNSLLTFEIEVVKANADLEGPSNNKLRD